MQEGLSIQSDEEEEEEAKATNEVDGGHDGATPAGRRNTLGTHCVFQCVPNVFLMCRAKPAGRRSLIVFNGNDT